jgi:hypothetical protein
MPTRKTGGLGQRNDAKLIDSGQGHKDHMVLGRQARHQKAAEAQNAPAAKGLLLVIYFAPCPMA